MNKVHFTLQGKGGIGKSYVTSLIAQYYQEKEAPFIAIDTDPVNSTLAGYKGLGAQRIELIEKSKINPRMFDQLIEKILSTDSNFVIDNGASSFVPLTYYLLENDIVNLLTENHKEVVVHTVIAGRQALVDTLAGLDSIMTSMPEQTTVIVWLNEFFGEIEADGKGFEDMKAYQRHKDRITGLVHLPRQSSETFGWDMEKMLEKRMTFQEIRMSEEFSLMSKSRLHRVKTSAFEQLQLMM